jgi:hypothetical protein
LWQRVVNARLAGGVVIACPRSSRSFLGDDFDPRAARSALLAREPGFQHPFHPVLPIERDNMNKLLSSLVFAALASFGFSAHAASHAAGAPMKAEAAKPAASASAKKAAKPASGAKAEMKKEEAKK